MLLRLPDDHGEAGVLLARPITGDKPGGLGHLRHDLLSELLSRRIGLLDAHSHHCRVHHSSVLRSREGPSVCRPYPLGSAVLMPSRTQLARCGGGRNISLRNRTRRHSSQAFRAPPGSDRTRAAEGCRRSRIARTLFVWVSTQPSAVSHPAWLGWIAILI